MLKRHRNAPLPLMASVLRMDAIPIPASIGAETDNPVSQSLGNPVIQFSRRSCKETSPCKKNIGSLRSAVSCCRILSPTPQISEHRLPDVDDRATRAASHQCCFQMPLRSRLNTSKTGLCSASRQRSTGSSSRSLWGRTMTTPSSLSMVA